MAVFAVVAVLIIGYMVATQTVQTPFQAMETGSIVATAPVSGIVASIGDNRFDIQLDTSDHMPQFTILVTDLTTIRLLGMETTPASFTDLEIGDRVTVTPVAERNDYLREAFSIDIFR